MAVEIVCAADFDRSCALAADVDVVALVVRVRLHLAIRVTRLSGWAGRRGCLLVNVTPVVSIKSLD